MCEVATIERFCKPGIAGLVKMYIIDVNDILSIPAPNLDWIITGNIVLKAGTGFKTVNFREQTAGLADELQDAIGGGFRKNLGLKIPKYGNLSNKWIYNLVGTRFIALIKDFNDQVIMVGDLSNPVRLDKATGNTGQKLNDENGWAAVMVADTTKPCYLYEGEIIMEGQPVTHFVVEWGWSATPFKILFFDSFSFQKADQFAIGSTVFPLDFTAASAGNYLAVKYPDTLTPFTKWQNSPFNYGQIPDQVFFVNHTANGSRYAHTRVKPALEKNNKTITFS